MHLLLKFTLFVIFIIYMVHGAALVDSRTTRHPNLVLPQCPEKDEPIWQDRLRPDNYDCKKFYECYGGVPIPKECLYGLVYDHTQRVSTRLTK